MRSLEQGHISLSTSDLRNSSLDAPFTFPTWLTDSTDIRITDTNRELQEQPTEATDRFKGVKTFLKASAIATVLVSFTTPTSSQEVTTDLGKKDPIQREAEQYCRDQIDRALPPTHGAIELGMSKAIKRCMSDLI